MMTKDTDMGDTDLDILFAQARAAVPKDDAALLARVYADGLRLQPQPTPPVQKGVGAPAQWWTTLIQTLGGRRGLAGLGFAGVVGVMVGFVQPGSVLALADPFIAATVVDEVDLMPGIDAILTEG